MRTLLEHTVDILSNPDPELLPDNLYTIYKSWENTFHEKLHTLRPQIVRNVREAEEKARREREQQARRSVRPSPRAEAKEHNNTNEEKDVMNPSKHGTPYHSTHPSAAPSKHTTPRDETHFKDTLVADTKPPSIPSSARDSPMGDVVEPVITEVTFDEKVAAETHRVITSLSMDDISTPDTRKKILILSRIERMHLPIMLLYLVHREKYNETVCAFMKAQKPRNDHK